MEEEKRKKRKKIAVIAVLVAAAVVYSGISHRAGGDIEVQSHTVSHTEDGSEDESSDTGDTGDGETVQKSGKDGGEKNSEQDKDEEQIFVDVGGAVKYPKVVCIGKGARVFEAIEAAGGVAADAETKYLNMAAECSDGQKIYVPTSDEMSQAQSGESEQTGLFSTKAEGLSQTGTESADSGGDGKININTATSEQLQTLDGIGPSMAARIIEYRQSNGKFQSVDDLTNVSGIGEKTLAKFSSKVCV